MQEDEERGWSETDEGAGKRIRIVQPCEHLVVGCARQCLAPACFAKKSPSQASGPQKSEWPDGHDTVERKLFGGAPQHALARA